MKCRAHPGDDATEACTTCSAAGCPRCLVFAQAGEPLCERCGSAELARIAARGSAAIVIIALGYLVALAVSYHLFKARPYVGGIAALAAIALGRVLQVWLTPQAVTRRSPPAEIEG